MSPKKILYISGSLGMGHITRDLAIVQSGGTTTIELTALRKPFLCFTIEGQFGQELYVAERLARHRAGVRMTFSQTTPEALTEKALQIMNSLVHFVRIPVDGDRKAARIIGELLGLKDKNQNTAPAQTQQANNSTLL